MVEREENKSNEQKKMHELHWGYRDSIYTVHISYSYTHILCTTNHIRLDMVRPLYCVFAFVFDFFLLFVERIVDGRWSAYMALMETFFFFLFSMCDGDPEITFLIYTMCTPAYTFLGLFKSLSKNFVVSFSSLSLAFCSCTSASSMLNAR